MTAWSSTGRRVRSALAGLAGLAVAATLALPAGGASVPGSAGTDTSLPATDSQVEISGRGSFADLRIKVNQTRNLVNQAISITWTGATPTITGASRFDGHHLQIMQCWGDDDGTVPGNPGPPPEQCVQGATDSVYGGRNGGVFPAGGNALERIVSRSSWANFDPAEGHLDPRTGLLWKPFRAVDAKVVDVHYDPDFNPAVVGGNYWLNPYFNAITTNEIAGGRTGVNGSGAELFEVTTGLESSGLGCGQAVQPVVGSAPRVPKCWLVVVPRGSPREENAGTPFEARAEQVGVYTSPLSSRAWRNRIAVPLEFNPIDSPCRLADDQRRLGGTELAAAAVSSWQPKLCASPGSPPYAYGIVSDSTARQQLVGGATGAPGMVVVSRPLDRTRVDAGVELTYAPLTLSAAVIGFNVERNPKLGVDPEEEALRGVRVAAMNLTPRLVAKLLTQSYRTQVAIRSQPPYEWVRTNPAHLGVDADFVQFNPEFDLLQVGGGGKNFGGLVMSSRGSDAARQLWEWILSDPEAKAWLDGAPDQWGMKVNPVYATLAAANTTGSAYADPVPDTLAKSDPYCYRAPPRGAGGSVVPPPLCGTDWLPYTQSMRDAARLTRAADDGARTTEDPFAQSADRVYRPDGPQTIGSKAILSLTDSPSANQYGLQMARLSRSGDAGPNRTFIAADSAGLTAAVDAMTAKSEPAVREPDPRAAGPAAYPLATLTYAVASPLALDDRARSEYAAFVDYAAGPGQVSGPEIGQLPAGYAPLPAPLRTQALAAARTIRELRAPAAATGPDEPAAGPAPPTAVGAAGPVQEPAAAAGPASARAGSPGSGPEDSGAAPGAPTGEVLLAAAGSEADGSPGGSSLAGPVVALARSRFVLPLLGGIALLSALGALEITKRPRRPGSVPPPGPGHPTPSGAGGR